MNTFAITFSVKNEQKLLKLAIPYYLSLGCKRIYVYLDGSTDNSQEIAKSFGDRIVVRSSVKTSELSNPPKWIGQISNRWDESMDVRKRINTFHATLAATQEGIEWISCIDPDEIIIANISSKLNENHLLDFLKAQSDDTDVIEMSNLEVVPSEEVVQNPFTECKMFLARRPLCETIGRISNLITRKLSFSPRSVALIESIWYDLLTPGPRLRNIINPSTNRRIPTRHFLGYCGVKSFIRVESGLHSIYNVHKWNDDKKKLKRAKSGNILHFDLYDFASLKEKFRQRSPKSFVKDFNTRYEIGQLALNATEEQLRTFFNSQICIKDPDFTQKLIMSGSIIVIDSVADFMSRIESDSLSYINHTLKIS